MVWISKLDAHLLFDIRFAQQIAHFPSTHSTESIDLYSSLILKRFFLSSGPRASTHARAFASSILIQRGLPALGSPNENERAERASTLSSFERAPCRVQCNLFVHSLWYPQFISLWLPGILNCAPASAATLHVLQVRPACHQVRLASQTTGRQALISSANPILIRYGSRLSPPGPSSLFSSLFASLASNGGTAVFWHFPYTKDNQSLAHWPLSPSPKWAVTSLC